MKSLRSMVLIGLIVCIASVGFVVACESRQQHFQPLAFPTRSDATVFNAVRAAQVDAGNLTATTANVTTADVGTLNAPTLSVTNTLSVQTVNAMTATITNALVVGGAQFSGAIRFGTVQTQTNGAEVTHGFSVTPTACIVSMRYTGTDIISATVRHISQTVFTANVSQPGTMYWMCGR